MNIRHSIILLTILLCASTGAHAEKAEAAAPEIISLGDIVYADIDGVQMKLDIHLPANAGAGKPLPLIVWIHGGGWINKNKSSCFPLRVKFPNRGYAVASIDYRKSNEAPFPAQLEDCKAAVRWLRKNAAKYNIDPARIGVWGSSAGAHLAMLLGVTGDERQFNVGANLDVSSRVLAVADFYGPADFTGKHAPLGRAAPFVEKLLGGPVAKKMTLAAAASPLTYVSKSSPPLLIIHGTKDATVPIAQSKAMRDAMKKAGAPCKLTIIEGAGHGGKAFAGKKLLDEIDAHFAAHLKKQN